MRNVFFQAGNVFNAPFVDLAALQAQQQYAQLQYQNMYNSLIDGTMNYNPQPIGAAIKEPCDHSSCGWPEIVWLKKRVDEVCWRA